MVRYKMLGRDVNSSPTQYRTWVVDNTPDFEGELYTGLKSGTDPFVDVVAYQIQDGYAVVDFNLPAPLFWQTAKQTLPTGVYNSQLAVVNGFVYLFGGQNSDIIYRADLDRPTIWEDTGARLPTTLCGAQFAIIDGYMYLFGGLGGPTEEARDTIYKASVDNPLIWIDTGAVLPAILHKSQLGIYDGYMYLFGGRSTDLAKSYIWRASTSDPLTWTDTGYSLPKSLYGSQIALIDGYFYLLGGLVEEDSPPTANIYKADATNPTFFFLDGVLPFAACYGQFFTIGDKGYLITPEAYIGTQPYLTRILRCNLSAPANWIDTLHTTSGDITQSQVAIIYDRIFLFGGNGNSRIFVSDQVLKYSTIAGSPAQIYGNITRTQYQSTVDPLDLIKVIGFPYWKTDYKH